MTDLRQIIRATLAETNGDELAAAGAILRQCEEPLFLQAVIEALTPQLQAQSPTLEQTVEEARAAAAGDDERLAALLRERNDAHKNPQHASRIGREVRHGLIRVLVTALRQPPRVASDAVWLMEHQRHLGGVEHRPPVQAIPSSKIRVP